MRINNNMQNKPVTSFKGVKIEAFNRNSPYIGITGIIVKFTEAERTEAGKILNLIPNSNADDFSIFMTLSQKSTGRRTGKPGIKVFGVDDYFNAKKPLKSDFYRGYSEDLPQEGKAQFEQFCALMQRATAESCELVQNPEAVLKEIKEFFTIRK